jgi:hypothetical protein
VATPQAQNLSETAGATNVGGAPASRPHVLTYDTLPSHSRLRREVLPDGTLTILAPAEEPGPLARRAAEVTSAWTAGFVTVGLLAVAIGMLYPVFAARVRLLPSGLSTLLLVSIGAFAVALFLLLWKIDSSTRIEKLVHALDRSTALAASRGRLLIETASRDGARSERIEFDDRPVEIRVVMWGNKFMCCLAVKTGDGVVRMLPGRDYDELVWVARELRRVIEDRAGETR